MARDARKDSMRSKHLSLLAEALFMQTERIHEVIVVGGGNAALCAAIRARLADASVLARYQRPQFQMPNNLAGGGG